MANNFYNHGSFPTTGSAATSASMRAELDSIAAGFDKMPTLTGNANEIVVVNPSATGLDSIPTLPATSGGTGFASYAVGDLVFANTTSTLAKLADVATGNALISGGVGVAPSYGKIGLTTHVTGTLPVANGGTGITSFGTGVATALGINVGTAGAFVVNGGALGTPSSGTVTNLTGTASININGTVGATTPAAGTFTDLTVNTSGVISVNTSGDALRITQTGSGNALVVEDSTNPDSTPFVVDASGKVLNGFTAPFTGLPSFSAEYQQLGTIGWTLVGRYGANITSPNHVLLKSRSTTIGSWDIVSSGDGLGGVRMYGDDGTQFVEGARIEALVDGTPGTNDMPGRLVFSTTADGASSPTERMRIWNQGSIGLGTTGDASIGLRVGKVVTGATSAVQVQALGAIQSDVTANGSYYTTSASTQATSFTLTNLNHFSAAQGTFGLGSTVTNQFGFSVASSLTGATNNYGFYSNIASGTGRWNFYANGTAENYFGGATTISVNSTSDALRITQTGTGNALVVEDSTNPDNTPFVIDAAGRVIGGIPAAQGSIFGGGYNPQIQVWGVGPGTASQSFASFNTAGTGNGSRMWLTRSRGSFTAGVPTYGIVSNGDSLGDIQFSGDDGTVGGNFVTAAQILVQVDGTPGTNDMPGRLVFSTTADGASTPTERMRIDSAGNVGIGSTSLTGRRLVLSGTVTGSTTSYGEYAAVTFQSDVTTHGYGVRSQNSTQAAAFTLGNLSHFGASQGTIGATSAVTNQFGFNADSSLTGATNNYGFYSNIASGTGRWNFYANGTADNYFAGNVGIGTSSPAYPLQVSTASETNIAITGGTASETNIFFGDSGSATIGRITYNNNGDYMRFNVNAAERMRIDSSGNVGIGTSSPATKLHVAGTFRSTDTTSLYGTATVRSINFGSSEVAWAQATTSTFLNFCDASGNNGANYSLTIRGLASAGAAAATLSFVSISASELYCLGVYNAVVGGTNRDVFVDNAGKIGYVSSLRKTKTNIQDITDTSWLHQLNPVTFNYRKKDEEGGYTDEVDGDIQYGLIAEDVEQVRPDLCFYDEVDGEQELRGIQYSKLVPVMLKALQQQQAMIETLQAKVAALEGA